MNGNFEAAERIEKLIRKIRNKDVKDEDKHELTA